MPTDDAFGESFKFAAVYNTLLGRPLTLAATTAVGNVRAACFAEISVPFEQQIPGAMAPN